MQQVPSEIIHYLSVFGSQAPSIYHGSSSLPITNPGAPEDPNLVLNEKGQRAVPHVPYVIKGLLAAVADWSTAYRQHAFRYTPSKNTAVGKAFSSGKKAHRDGIVGDPQFMAFYQGLQEWMFRDGNRGEKKKNKKRKSDGDVEPGEDEDMTAPKKKTRFTFL